MQTLKDFLKEKELYRGSKIEILLKDNESLCKAIIWHYITGTITNVTKENVEIAGCNTVCCILSDGPITTFTKDDTNMTVPLLLKSYEIVRR